MALDGELGDLQVQPAALWRVHTTRRPPAPAAHIALLPRARQPCRLTDPESSAAERASGCFNARVAAGLHGRLGGT
jgi:hypothetical protein